MHHGFDINIAKKYGVLPAIMLEYIAHWVIYNRSLGQNRVKGKFWTYNSVAAMKEQFPYMSVDQIRYAIRKLKSEGLILVAKLNEDKKDHTNWYTLSASGERVCGVLFDEAEPAQAAENPSAEQAKTADVIWEKPYTEIPKTIRENSQMAWENSQILRTCNHSTITNNTLHTLPPYIPPSQNTPKIEYAEYVHMKESEYQTLVDKYGEETTKELISILDNYKGSKGRTYKDDYRAILSWVVNRWKEEHREKPPAQKSFRQQEHDDFMAFAEELAQKGKYVP